MPEILGARGEAGSVFGRRPVQKLGWLCVPEIAESLVEAQGDERRLVEAIRAAIAPLGFEQFVFSRRNRVRCGIGSRWSCWGDIPQDWAKLSRARNYAAIEPIRRQTHHMALPQWWERGTFRGPHGIDEYFAAAATFGIRSGVCIPLFGLDSRYVDFFDVYASTPRFSVFRRAETVRRLADLWTIGAVGHELLPPEALDVVSGDRNQAIRPVDYRRPVVNRHRSPVR